MSHPQITFAPLQPEQERLVLQWLHKPHVKEWFHGAGLQNTIQGIASFISGNEKRFDAWVAYCDGIPFGFLIIFEITKTEVEVLDSHLVKWVDRGKESITLDILIGDENYLGKGLATPMIEEFISQRYPTIDVVFIDPEASNSRAIHVYEKAGFEKIDNFIASWHPVTHVLMRKVVAISRVNVPGAEYHSFKGIAGKCLK